MSFNFSQQTCLETGNSFGIPVEVSDFCLTWVVAGPRPTTRSTGLTTGRGNPPAGPPDPDRPDRPGHPPGGLLEGSPDGLAGTPQNLPKSPQIRHSWTPLRRADLERFGEVLGGPGGSWPGPSKNPDFPGFPEKPVFPSISKTDYLRIERFRGAFC